MTTTGRKLNGNFRIIAWVTGFTALLVTFLSLSHFYGKQCNRIDTLEKMQERKADKDVVNEQFRSVNQKLDMIIKMIEGE